jgi:hypothetical protein
MRNSISRSIKRNRACQIQEDVGAWEKVGKEAMPLRKIAERGSGTFRALGAQKG